MKKIFRNSIYVLGVLVLLLVFALSYLSFFLPNVGPAPDLHIENSPEMVEHGRYLANHVMLCMDCHAVRDFTVFAGPPHTETLGAGGEVFDQNIGLPGSFISRNLTPYALSDWTDGEIFRAITSGVSKDGSAIFPVMPYNNYAQLAEEDIYAVITYIRSLEPIENNLPASKPDFPVNFLINTMPVKPNLGEKPSPDDVVSYGQYMITAAACVDCHTRMERGKYVGEPYAGDNEFILHDGSIVRSANLTPHETGLKNWSKEQFVSRFKMYADSTYVPRQVEPGQFQTVMPWLMYADMKQEDLEAIFEYLRTIPAVENRVQLFSPGINQ